VAWVHGVCKEEGQLKHWIDSGSFIAAMTDTKGNIFAAECDQSNEDLCWSFAFSMELTPDNQRVDDRGQILHQITRRLEDSSWHSCVHQIVQDAANMKNGPLLFRHLYDRTPEDVQSWQVPELWIPITLLGDVFHPVVSYAMVVGGSNALVDGVAVAKELLKENKSNGEALRRYEEPIRERSIPQGQKSKTNTA
jgi:hypothetical protein